MAAAMRYEHASPSMVWQCVKTHNAFLRKRGGITLSAEKTNAASLHHPQFFGLLPGAIGVGLNAESKELEMSTFGQKSRAMHMEKKPLARDRKAAMQTCKPSLDKKPSLAKFLNKKVMKLTKTGSASA